MSPDGAVTTRRAAGAADDGREATGQPGERLPDQAAATRYEAHGAGVVVARGSYDMQTVAPLATALGTAAEEYRKVVLDVSGVTFADSSFLNLLILTHRTTDLRLAGPTPQVKRLLEITGVDTVLTVRPTVEDAARQDACRT
ncbi:STAS domain-containing protein [Streptomyces sp. NPDC012825]|uniref:STAS domain-containing protein n=1 Tax=Streptomyces sp. NPDC012825 TaxID=3364851 RepID=UPI003675D14C